eukprot:m.92001 g.92001  ORF g.92001 m.92001 type:complete len:471 (-) comp15057_c0_seq4:105-1517(-)
MVARMCALSVAVGAGLRGPFRNTLRHQLLTRQWRSQFVTSYSTAPQRKRKRVVIVGSGWGGHAAFKTLDRTQFDISMVTTRNHFLFTPLLASTTVGTLEFRSIVQPIREAGFREEKDFHLSEVTDIDAEHNVVHCKSVLDDHAYPLKYDVLILSMGTRANTFGLPGVEEHALFLKEVVHAQRIRHRLLSNLELACQPGVDPVHKQQLTNFVVVGGGPTGVEFCGELYDFLQADISKYFPEAAQDVRVYLVEGREILSSFNDAMRSYALKKISERKRMVLVSANVVRVTEDAIELDNGDVIPTSLVVWSAGVGPQPLSATVGQRGWTMERGRIVVNGHLRVPTLPNVYAIGDCALVQDNPLPQTAQVAETMAYWLARRLNNTSNDPAHLSEKQDAVYRFQSKGLMAYIGGYRALVDLSSVARSEQARFKGFNGWFLWRSAYLTKQGSWKLRAQVPFDWLKTLLWGRNCARF